MAEGHSQGNERVSTWVPWEIWREIGQICDQKGLSRNATVSYLIYRGLASLIEQNRYWSMELMGSRAECGDTWPMAYARYMSWAAVHRGLDESLISGVE